MKTEIEDLRKSLEKTDDTFKGIEDSFESFVQSMISGTQDIGDAAKKLAVDVIQALTDIMRQAILAQTTVSQGGGGGFFGSLISSFFGGLTGLIKLPVTTVSPSLAGTPLGAGSVPLSAFIPGFAHGGLVTRPTLAMLGEEGPEAVIPLREMRSPDPGVNIIINNNAPVRVEASQRQGPGGIPEIILTITEAMAKDVRLGGSLANAISQTFGATRQGAIR